jgi:hypothetical protein
LQIFELNFFIKYAEESEAEEKNRELSADIASCVAIPFVALIMAAKKGFREGC